ncbi:hypothetical protein C8Q80DRAFT_7697 [Daedaleopsis nitida]|nr:hypothetical protein C8Q80DRAFT_7697 [Daedaleopsis nitida]
MVPTARQEERSVPVLLRTCSSSVVHSLRSAQGTDMRDVETRVYGGRLPPRGLPPRRLSARLNAIESRKLRSHASPTTVTDRHRKHDQGITRCAVGAVNGHSKRVQHGRDKPASEPPYSRMPLGRRPPWLQVALGDLYKEFPTARVTAYQGPRDSSPNSWTNWIVTCNECDEGQARTITTGPGKSLRRALAQHYSAVHAHLRRDGAPSTHTRVGSSRAPSSDPQAGLSDSDVERFLARHGLSSALGPALRAVGILDDGRIRALGRLPDSALEKLQTALAGEGLDLAACLLVSDGLRKAAIEE